MNYQLFVPDIIFSERVEAQIFSVLLPKNDVSIASIFKTYNGFKNVYRATIQKYEDGQINEFEFVKVLYAVVKNNAYYFNRDLTLSELAITKARYWCEKNKTFDRNVLNFIFQIVSGSECVEKEKFMGSVIKKGFFTNAQALKEYTENQLDTLVGEDTEKPENTSKMLEIFFTVFTKSKSFDDYATHVLNVKRVSIDKKCFST